MRRRVRLQMIRDELRRTENVGSDRNFRDHAFQGNESRVGFGFKRETNSLWKGNERSFRTGWKGTCGIGRSEEKDESSFSREERSDDRENERSDESSDRTRPFREGIWDPSPQRNPLTLHTQILFGTCGLDLPGRGGDRNHRGSLFRQFLGQALRVFSSHRDPFVHIDGSFDTSTRRYRSCPWDCGGGQGGWVSTSAVVHGSITKPLEAKIGKPSDPSIGRKHSMDHQDASHPNLDGWQGSKPPFERVCVDTSHGCPIRMVGGKEDLIRLEDGEDGKRCPSNPIRILWMPWGGRGGNPENKPSTQSISSWHSVPSAR